MCVDNVLDVSHMILSSLACVCSLLVKQDIYAFFNWANISKHPTTTIAIGILALIELIASIVILCRRQHNVQVCACDFSRSSHEGALATIAHACCCCHAPARL